MVDPNTWQGKEFVREWGRDQNKVVLSYTWVSNCITAGKALLEGDDWGGTKTFDDGLPIKRPSLDGEDSALASR